MMSGAGSQDTRTCDAPGRLAALYRAARGTLGMSIMAMALPVLGEQFCNVLVGLVDTFLAGRISKEATAAVGIAAYVGWLASMLSGFVGVGATALVARAVGADDKAGANRSTNQAMGMSGFLGVVLVITLLSAAAAVPRLMGLTPDAAVLATRYIRYDAAGQLLYVYMLVGAACLRGAGDTRTPMFIMVFINLVNIVLSTTLALGIGPVPALGVMGIVAGTVTARTAGGLLMLWVLFRGRSGLRIEFESMSPRREPIARILKIGAPAGLDAALMWAGHFTYLTFITHVSPDREMGMAAYAAHMIGVRIESLSYLPALAWGVASATLVGQALGAGEPDRARRVGHAAVIQLMPYACIMTAIFYFAAGWIFTVWSNDPAVHAQGIPALRLIAFAQPSLVMMIIYVSALRGAGDTRFPLWFTIAGVYAVRVPLAYLFGVVLQGGLIGAWTGMFFDLILRSVLSGWRFAAGAWTERVI